LESIGGERSGDLGSPGVSYVCQVHVEVAKDKGGSAVVLVEGQGFF
jgi:hypothetical protein